MSTSSKRFDIALSFPGEYRDFMGKLADYLAGQVGRDRVLYDKFHEAEFARPDLDVYLPNLYSSESELVSIFLCSEYKNKRWCKLEWRSVRQLITTAEQHRIMFLSFDDIGAIPELGILNGDGYVSIGKRKPEEIADLIFQRFKNTPGPSVDRGITKTQSIDHQQQISPSRLRHGTEHLFGREDEFANLDKAWNDPGTHVIILIAWGGVGKTALVSHWQASLAKRNYDGALYFDWSFYSQGSSEKGVASADTFIKAALLFFGDKEMAESAASPWDKGARLAELVSKRRTLLILDGMEPLQYPPGPMTGKLKDPAIEALLKGLAQKNAGLCVVTTRERVTDLDSFSNATVQQWSLQHLSVPAGVALLKQIGVQGTDSEFKALVEGVKGHALTLNLLGRFLKEGFQGDIRKRDLIHFEEADNEIQGGHAFRVIDAYVKWFSESGENGIRQIAVLSLLGLFDRPADAACLAALRKPPAIPGLTEKIIDINKGQWNLTLNRLADSDLILLKSDNSAIDAHPLIRDYFAKQLNNENPDGWREAHRRLYEYLTTSTVDKTEPTLEELQPLYQAVAHGCKAGLYKKARSKVYRDRILKGTGKDGFYSTNKLGAFGADLGAIACFFEEPWSKPTHVFSEADQAWLLNTAAFRLNALGRLSEALETRRVGLEMRINQKDWKNAARGCSNLSKIELALGNLKAALQDGKQSVEFADKSGNAFIRMHSRTTLADNLHQDSKIDESFALFREAETIQAKMQPQYPLLTSLPGFWYCDLLLAKAEQSAWQERRIRESGINNLELKRKETETTDCREVEKRAKKMFDWRVPSDSLPTIALDHLTLGRVGLYLSIFDLSDSDHRQSAIKNINTAVNALRSAGTQPNLPRGLLTRAWLRFLENDPSGSRADLDEAQQIAERGPMLLHLADVHLYRGRLFNDKEEIKKARALIEKCGYWRRKGELEDAEAELSLRGFAKGIDTNIDRENDRV
jgi:hypothetical protein